jgi:hypothetical protein
MTNFFDSKPEHSNDIKLTDENGHLKNPYTGGTDWFHSSTGHDTVFSDEFLNKISGFAGTYHTSKPDETLRNGYLHVNKIKMNNPLVVASHHDQPHHSFYNEEPTTASPVVRGQFHDLPSLVRHYINKYGPEVVPEHGNPNEAGAEKNFYKAQSENNAAKKSEWQSRVNKIKSERESDPWAVSDKNDPSMKHLPPEPAYDKRKFSSDYIKNFDTKQRLHVLREGARRDGYDGFIFHYNSPHPTIFVINPSSQIKRSKVVKEGTDEHKEACKVEKPIDTTNGLHQYIRKNDLFEAEKYRGADKRAS